VTREGQLVTMGVGLLAAAGGFGGGRAAAVPPSFLYERPAHLAAPGPQSLPVDLPLLVGSAAFRVETWPDPSGTPRRVARSGLSDLRFFDGEGREVPYLLVEPPSTEPTWRRAQALLPLPTTKKESGFEADLGEAVEVDRLRVRGLPAPFLKRLAVDGSGDRKRWARLAAEATLFDLPDSGLRLLELGFPAGSFRYLRVTWDDASSARLPLPREMAARVVRAEAPASPSLSMEVTVDRRPSEPGKSRFRLRLPAPALPVVALRLTVGGGDLSRRACVTEARLAGDGAHPTSLGQALLRRAVHDELVAEELRIPIEQPATARLELEVDDGDNPPLDLRSVAAELAELPWIYLDVPKGGTVVARWGQPKLEAPRYDLESARERARRVVPPAGAWGETRGPTAEQRWLGPPAALQSGGPVLDTQPFRYTRALADGPAGLVAVPLDAAVLAHSARGPGADFADLRIVDGAGRQLPYLLDRRPEPLVVALPPAIPVAVTDRRWPAGTSVYRLKLPYAGLPPARLVLRTGDRVFEREVRVLVEPGAGERRRRQALRTVATTTWRHPDPDTAAPALTLSLPTLGTAEVLLTVLDGDNSPLPLAAPELLLPCWHARFFRPASGEVRVVYGRRALGPPRYDLALLASTVLASPAVETTLGDEQATTRSEPVVLRPGIFWALMIGAVVTLVVLIVRLVRGAGAADPE
jgi:hypothetical protein